MLVLNRKRHEEVVVEVGAVRLVVSVVEIRGDKVRIGFEAPKDCPVHRREIWEKIKGSRDEPDKHV